MDKFVSDYWPIILALIPVLIKILNKVTPKWYDQDSKFKKFMLLLIDLLDVLKVEKPPKKEV